MTDETENPRTTNKAAAAKTAAPPAPRELSEDEVRFRENDPYVQAFNLAVGHLSRLPARLKELFAAELGVYRGRSLAVLLETGFKSRLPVRWIAFDTFEGLPPLSTKDVELAPPNAAYLKRTMFDDTTMREVEAYLEPVGAGDRLEFVIGDIAETLPTQPERSYFFVNVSIKTYAAHMLALNYFYPRMSQGGVILFDDFFNRGNFPMAETAIREFFADKPEPIYWIFCGEGQSTFRRAFIVKA